MWIEAKLDEIKSDEKGSLVSGPFGSNIGSRFFVEQGIPVIRGNNLTLGEEKFIDNGFVFITEEKATELRNCNARAGDIIFTAAGTLGQVGLIPTISEYETYIISNKQMRLRLDTKRCQPLFVYYCLSAPHMRSFIASQNKGSSVPLLTLGIVRNLKIPMPPLAVQKKIAAILSAYDDLIENNRRRIALLEKMAEEIYREWFVRMRFPGHENVKIVKGVPDGWQPTLIGNLLRRIPLGKLYEQKTASQTGKVPILDQGQSGVIGYHDNEPGVIASLENPIIVFANHTCYQRLIFFPFSVIQNVLPYIPSDTCKSHVLWLHYATYRVIEFSEYKGHWPEFVAKQVYYPGTYLTELFGSRVEPMLKQVFLLEKTIETLKSTRDMLLPRLISGKLSVENLDIRFPPSMEEMNHEV